jgi:hypothetical protein
MVFRIMEQISKELRYLSDWSKFELKQTTMAVLTSQSSQLDIRNGILLMAKYPDSKPIWDENYHLFTCFACDYLQKNKLEDYCNTRECWLTKIIMKDKDKHLIAFWPKCVTNN